MSSESSPVVEGEPMTPMRSTEPSNWSNLFCVSIFILLNLSETHASRRKRRRDFLCMFLRCAASRLGGKPAQLGRETLPCDPPYRAETVQESQQCRTGVSLR